MRDITVYSRNPKLHYKIRNLNHKLNFIKKLLVENSKDLGLILDQVEKKSGRNIKDLDGLVDGLKKMASDVGTISSTMVFIKTVYLDDGGDPK